MKKRLFLLFLLLFVWNSYAQLPNKFQKLIDEGAYSKAQELMRLELATNLNINPASRQLIGFEIERLERIKKDFTRTKDDIIDYIKTYIPDVSEADLAKWEESKALEFKIIDGEKKFFKWAGPNLFRVDKEAKTIKQNKNTPKPKDISEYDRDRHVEKLVNIGKATGEKFINPQRFRVTYTLTVDENVVPAGKVIRCWLPFPREIIPRQTDVNLISSNPQTYLISKNEEYLQRSIYLEKAAVQFEKTIFQVVFEYTSYAVFNKITAKQVKSAVITNELAPFVAERQPHIVFTPEMKALSRDIVGKETNPYYIAKKIFKWIDDNIPWASAREYSTFYNISHYVYENRHADCGMQTIFFMTLCRMNGIPTKWQSGWSNEPDGITMHDWGEIYFEPYGWLPVDVTYGLGNSNNDTAKWFFLGSMDCYRLIVNDDYSQNFYPAKIHFRSETIDFQRGEVEWEGGNLYFDQWDYDFIVESIN